jgi:hypothetical protein
VHAAGTVTWSLGSVPPNSGGRERVSVDMLTDGTLLVVDAATCPGIWEPWPRRTAPRSVSSRWSKAPPTMARSSLSRSSGNDVVFENTTIPAGTVATCAAPGSIVVQSTVVIEGGAFLELISPRVRWTNDFAVPDMAETMVNSANPQALVP